MKKILISLLLITSLFAEFKVGDKIESFTLPNQFDKKVIFDDKVKTLIMVFEKDMGSMVNDYLKEQNPNFLEKKSALFVADISGMPSFVTSMFALPKMRKYPHSIALIYDEFGEKFNRADEKITIFKLKNNQIEEIEFISDIKELKL